MLVPKVRDTLAEVDFLRKKAGVPARERERESSALHATEGSLEAGRAGAARAQAGTHTLMSVR